MLENKIKETENALLGEQVNTQKKLGEEFMKCLEKHYKINVVQVHTEQLLKSCQEFDKYYTIYKKIEPAIRVLQNYVDDENYIAKRKRKKNQDTKVKQSIEEKLYAEFFTEIYREHYKDKFCWNNVIESIDTKEDLVIKILTDYFAGTEVSCIKMIARSVRKAYESSYKKIDLTNLHQAINIFEEAIKTPLPSVENSLEKVITTESLEYLIGLLKARELGGFLLTIAPIRIALNVGAYKTYARRKKFFNLKCEYNLTELKHYIDGYTNKKGQQILGLMNVYMVYKDTKDELLKLKKLS